MKFQPDGPASRAELLPVQGRVRGGPFDGWAYTFAGFGVGSDLLLRISLVVTRPGWPFPRTVALRGQEFAALEEAPSLLVDAAQPTQQLDATIVIANAALEAWLGADEVARRVIQAQLSDRQAAKLQEYAAWSAGQQARGTRRGRANE